MIHTVVIFFPFCYFSESFTAYHSSWYVFTHFLSDCQERPLLTAILNNIKMGLKTSMKLQRVSKTFISGETISGTFEVETDNQEVAHEGINIHLDGHIAISRTKMRLVILWGSKWPHFFCHFCQILDIYDGKDHRNAFIWSIVIEGPAIYSVPILHLGPRRIFKNFKNNVCRYIPKVQKKYT